MYKRQGYTGISTLGFGRKPLFRLERTGGTPEERLEQLLQEMSTVLYPDRLIASNSVPSDHYAQPRSPQSLHQSMITSTDATSSNMKQAVKPPAVTMRTAAPSRSSSPDSLYGALREALGRDGANSGISKPLPRYASLPRLPAASDVQSIRHAKHKSGNAESRAHDDSSAVLKNATKFESGLIKPAPKRQRKTAAGLLAMLETLSASFKTVIDSVTVSRPQFGGMLLQVHDLYQHITRELAQGWEVEFDKQRQQLIRYGCAFDSDSSADM